jgi:hypothetical protein
VHVRNEDAGHGAGARHRIAHPAEADRYRVDPEDASGFALAATKVVLDGGVDRILDPDEPAQHSTSIER